MVRNEIVRSLFGGNCNESNQCVEPSFIVIRIGTSLMAVFSVSRSMLRTFQMSEISSTVDAPMESPRSHRMCNNFKNQAIDARPPRHKHLLESFTKQSRSVDQTRCGVERQPDLGLRASDHQHVFQRCRCKGHRADANGAAVIANTNRYDNRRT